MLRKALFGVVVFAAAGCASAAGDITWTNLYVNSFGSMTKCLAAPSSGQYSLSALILRRAGSASITMARSDQQAMSGEFTIERVADDSTNVSWRRVSNPPGGQQQIDIDARAKADRCGNPYGN
jgi:hypothetical protein